MRSDSARGDPLVPRSRLLGRARLLAAAVRRRSRSWSSPGSRWRAPRRRPIRRAPWCPIRDVVACLVVAGVVRLTGSAAVHGGFFYGLLSFSTAEQTAGRDAGLDEGSVVGPTIESGRLGGQTLIGKVLGEDPSICADPGGPSTPPAIHHRHRRIGHSSEIRACRSSGSRRSCRSHCAELGDVVLGAEQACLLGAPEGEAQLRFGTSFSLEI